MLCSFPSQEYFHPRAKPSFRSFATNFTAVVTARASGAQGPKALLLCHRQEPDPPASLGMLPAPTLPLSVPGSQALGQAAPTQICSMLPTNTHVPLGGYSQGKGLRSLRFRLLNNLSFSFSSKIVTPEKCPFLPPFPAWGQETAASAGDGNRGSWDVLLLPAALFPWQVHQNLPQTPAPTPEGILGAPHLSWKREVPVLMVAEAALQHLPVLRWPLPGVCPLHPTLQPLTDA